MGNSASTTGASDLVLALQSARKELGLSVGGIFHFEHMNLVVQDAELAKTFYVDGLGLTQDPHKGSTTWVNVSPKQQLHLVESPEEESTVVNGCTGIVVPNLQIVSTRLESVKEKLKDTKFNVEYVSSPVEMLIVTCPWGNIFHVFDEKESVFDSLKEEAEDDDLSFFEKTHVGAYSTLGPPGIRYVNFNVNEGQSEKIAKYYRSTFGCPNVKTEIGPLAAAVVSVGDSVFVFTEVGNTQEEIEAQSAFHVCVYVTAFDRFLKSIPSVKTNPRFKHTDRCDTVEQAIRSRQFRFKDIKDESGETVYELEHEMRSMMHTKYMVPLTYQPPSKED